MAAQQAQAFAMMALCGAACAGVFDVALLLLRMMGGGAVLTALLDISFGVLLAAGMTVTGLKLRMDPFRLYAFMGVGVGALLWFATVGMLLRKARAAWPGLFKKEQNKEKKIPKEQF